MSALKITGLQNWPIVDKRKNGRKNEMGKKRCEETKTLSEEPSTWFSSREKEQCNPLL